MKIDWKKLIWSILLPLAVGGLAGFITKDSFARFDALNKPALAPPAILFPIVWTILYILMGISFYLVWTSRVSEQQKKSAFTIYAVQLAVNFLWPIIFFGFGMYLLAFIWLLLLWILIIIMISSFFKSSSLAALLQIPYLLWVTFAGYLNLMIYLLN